MRYYVTTKKTGTNLIIKLLWIAAVLVSIKTVFTDFGADNAYTMAMSFRHLSGDAMFLEMWEPHQTSIFFTDILMWIYGLIVPSFAGAAIYLQICGTLFFALIAVFLFKEIKALSGSTAAHLATIFFLIFRAKQSVFPEYANLQIGFSVLMLLVMTGFLQDQKKYGRLVLSALFLCLAVLTYPSCVITLVAAIVILCLYSERKLRNSLIFTGTAACAGVLYVAYFALRIGPSRFIDCIKGILSSDIHGNEAFVSRFDYFRGFLVALAWVAVSVILTAAVWAVARFIFKKSLNKFGVFGGIFFCGNAVMLLLQNKTGLDWTCCFYIIPLVLIVLALADMKNATKEQRRFFVSAGLVSVSSCIAAAMLSNLGIITFVPFLVLAGAASFAVIANIDRAAFAGAALIVATVLFSRGLVVWGYANKGGVHMVYEIERYVKSGPTFGILTDYMTSKEM